MKTDKKLLKEFCRYLNVCCKEWWVGKQHGARKRIEEFSIEAGYDHCFFWIDWLITNFNSCSVTYKSQPGTIHDDDRNLIIDKIWAKTFNSGKLK